MSTSVHKLCPQPKSPPINRLINDRLSVNQTLPQLISSVKHRRRSSPSPSVSRVTHAVSAVKPSVNSGRPFVSHSSITHMEQSASCCQRHSVTAVFPSAFKDISVSIVIRLLTVSPVLSQRFSHR